MRLIDADELKKKAKMIDWLCNKQVVSVEDIDNAPTIEQKYYERIVAQINPVIDERPQGDWGKHGECPFCSYIRQWEDDKFCGNCGADMRKEETK